MQQKHNRVFMARFASPSFGLRCKPTVYSETRRVPPEMAAVFRTERLFPRQRNIDKKNVVRLAEQQTQGYFVPGTQILFCVYPDGSMHMVNGNHTCEAIIRSGVPIELTLTYVFVKDVDEAGEVYSVIDYQKVRTRSDSLRAAGLENIPMLPKASAGLAIILAGFQANLGKASPSAHRDVASAIRKYDRAIDVLDIAWHKAPAKNVALLRRAPTMSVALETAQYQPAPALEFWGGAARNDGLSADDPRAYLLSQCQANSVAGQDRRERALLVAAASWNAWFRGDKVKYVQPERLKGDGFRILGTPWQRGDKSESEDVNEGF